MSERILFALALMFVLTVTVWTGYAQKEKPATTRYEYQVIDNPIHSRGMEYGVNKLNELGFQGWEIVGFRDSFIYLKRARR
jgi:hypothetical protein